MSAHKVHTHGCDRATVSAAAAAAATAGVAAADIAAAAPKRAWSVSQTYGLFVVLSSATETMAMAHLRS
jgi:TRAP-type mannitol/chloroaromatic compound transport system substrate-binding protein